MRFPSLERGFQIFCHPKEKFFKRVNDFAKIERDIEIAKVAKRVFIDLAALLFISAIPISFVSFPLACDSVAFAIASLLVKVRFDLFFKKLSEDIGKFRHVREVHRMLNAGDLNWGNGVPDALNRPLKINPQATLEENLVNLSNFANYLPNFTIDPRNVPNPPPIAGMPVAIIIPTSGRFFYDDSIKRRASMILSKCWAFAYSMKDLGSYIYACDLCVYMDDKILGKRKTELLTFTFGEIRLTLPKYLAAIFTTIRPLPEGPIDMGLSVAKDELSRLIKFIHPDSQESTVTRWFASCFPGDVEGIKNRTAFLKTLGNTAEEQHMRSLLDGVHISPEIEIEPLLQDLRDASVRFLILKGNLPSATIESLVNALPNLERLRIKQPADLDEAVIPAFTQRLQAIHPNLNLSMDPR